MLRRIVVILSCLLTAALARAESPQLPPPHALGGHCILLVPCAESGPFAAHVRALLQLHGDDSSQGLDVGGHLGLSFSFWRWAEAGISLHGLHRDRIGWQQGPATAWGRLSPPFLSWTGGDDDESISRGLSLALQVEYAAGYPPFDGQSTLFPSTHTYLAVVDALAWRLRASLSAGAQLADGAGPSYRGVQAGVGVWLRLDGPGIQAGAEVLGRAGSEAGTWRSEWTAALSFRMFDEGHHAIGGFVRGSDGGSTVAIGYGFSCGPSYAASTCFRGVGRSLFEQVQESLGKMMIASWRARQEAQRLQDLYAAQHPAPVGRWITARAFDPPPAADCGPYGITLRDYPCRRVAGWRSAADLIKGAITGTVESLPGANLMRRAAPGTYWFEVGRGAAQVATGIVETGGAAVGAATGGGISGTGAGALVGVPVAAGAVAVGASGVKAVGDGVRRLVVTARDAEEAGTSAAAKSNGAEADAAPKAKPAKERQGGTYLLTDPDTGEVMRSGRTKALKQREKQHKHAPETGQLDFEVDVETNDYKEQRGIEQLRHEQYRPPMNKINPISPQNPRRQEYLDAGAKKLQTLKQQVKP